MDQEAFSEIEYYICVRAHAGWQFDPSIYHPSTIKFIQQTKKLLIDRSE